MRSFRGMLVAAACASAVAACASPAPVGDPSLRNAPIAAAGTPAGVPVTATERETIAAAVAETPAARRAHLRYARAVDEAGKPRLVVYDDLGLGAGGRTGRKGEYVVFRVINGSDGSHYDPEQNAVVAPLPVPVERDVTVPK